MVELSGGGLGFNPRFVALWHDSWLCDTIRGSVPRIVALLLPVKLYCVSLTLTLTSQISFSPISFKHLYIKFLRTRCTLQIYFIC